MEAAEILKIVEIEDRLRNIKWHHGNYYKTPEKVKKELKFYMDEHRIPFLRETARIALHPQDIKRFDCTLAILHEVGRHARELGKLVSDYEQEVKSLREILYRNLALRGQSLSATKPNCQCYR